MLEATGKTCSELLRLVGLKGEDVVERLSPRERKRYEVVKAYWEGVERGEIKEPILPVIGGMPSSGKTSISSYVAKAVGLKIIIGGDQFRAVLREFISREENPAFFVSVYKAWELFGEFSRENVIKGFLAQAKILNKAIERLVVDRGIRDGEGFSVDFLHFLPSLWHKETLEHPSVVPIILYVSDEERWKEYMKGRVKYHLKGGWERLIKAIESYAIMRDYQLEVARELGIPTIDTTNFDEAKEKVLDLVVDRMEKIISIKKWDKEHPMISKIKKERREKS